MGSSPDAHICYGIAIFDGDADLPWYSYDEESWWREVNEFVNPVESPFDAVGNYKPGRGKADSDAYFDARRAWDDAHPLPFELVTAYCSDHPGGFVLAAPGTVVTCWEGGPDLLDLSKLVVPADAADKLLDFVHDHLNMDRPTLGWYLSAFYG